MNLLRYFSGSASSTIMAIAPVVVLGCCAFGGLIDWARLSVLCSLHGARAYYQHFAYKLSGWLLFFAVAVATILRHMMAGHSHIFVDG